MKHAFNSVESYVSDPSKEGMENIEARMSSAFSKIDKAVKKGVLHPNNAARKKARLARFLKKHVQLDSASA